MTAGVGGVAPRVHAAGGVAPGDARVHEETIAVLGISADARQHRQHAIDARSSQNLADEEARLADLPAPEEAVVPEALVERQDHEAVRGRADVAAAIAREQLALVRAVEVREAGGHLEIVGRGDGVALHDLHDARQLAAAGVEERVAARVLAREVALPDQTGVDERDPHRGLEVVDRRRILVLTALDRQRDAAVMREVLAHHAVDLLLEPEDDRQRKRARERALGERVAEEHEGDPRRAGGVQVHEEDRPARALDRLVDHVQELALLEVLGVVAGPVGPRLELSHARRGPDAVQILRLVAPLHAQRREVARERDQLAAQVTHAGREDLEHALAGDRAARLVAVHAADADQRRAGELAADPADLARGEARPADRLRRGRRRRCRFRSGVRAFEHVRQRPLIHRAFPREAAPRCP